MSVHVVGAGPAGSVAAISALRAGHTALLSEEHPQAGVPTHCSGLFSADGLSRLKGYLDYRPLVRNPIYGAIVHLGDTRLDIRRREPVAYVCDRAGLDQQLAGRAEEEGVRVEYNHRVHLPAGLGAGTIIGADGPFSHVARHFGFPAIPTFASTLQAHVPYACEDARRVEVYVSAERFPGFFAWIIPQNEEVAEFGVGVVRPHSVSRAWRALLKLKGVEYNATPKGAAIPIRVRSRTAGTFGRRNVLLVGDAAGQTKSTTGGGVIFGSQCAMLAGRYAGEPWKYDMVWKLRHGPDLALHRWTHRYLSRLGESMLSAHGRLLARLRFDDYLSSHGHMDRPLHMMGPALLGHLLSLPFQKV